MNEVLRRDQNFVTVLAGVTDDDDEDITMLRVDPMSKRLLVKATISGSVVTDVTATLPITSSGGDTPNISTSMSTNKLIGRGTSGTGVMEEITLGTNISLSGNTLNVPTGAGGVSSITGTANQVIADASTGAVTLSLPQDIATTSTPTFGGLTLSGGESITSTSPNQLLIKYDVSNYQSITVNSTGNVTYALTGTTPRFTFSQGINLPAGTATASTAPLKFSSGTLNTTAEAGAMEFLAERFAITPTSLARMAISGVLFTSTADATVADTTDETTIIGSGVATGGGLILPANFFVAGKSLRLRVRGILSDTGTPTINIRFKLGSTTIVSTGAITIPTGLTNRYFVVEVTLTCRTTGATGTVIASGELSYDANATPPNSETRGMSQTSASVIDTTASQVVGVTAEWGNESASNTITGQITVLEVLN